MTKEQKEEVLRLYRLNPDRKTGRPKGCIKNQIDKGSLAWVAKELNLDKHAVYRVVYPQDWSAYRAKRKAKLQEHVREYFEQHPCIDCGETDPICLDFDHRNPREKHKTVSAMIMSGNSIKVLIAEIEKCDVRCSNCHRRRHAKDKSVYMHKRLE